jgi:hypothetical protein
MRTVSKLTGLTALALLAGTLMGQTGGPGLTDPKKPAEEKKPSPLEEMLAQAMRDNPDVRVAEAKVREAEAELNRVRLQAIQKVVAHQHTIETLTTAVRLAEARYQAAEAALRFAEVQYARTLELSKRGGVAKEDVDAARAKVEQAKADLVAAQATLQAAKADVAKAQAELPYLLGKGGKTDDKTAELTRRWALDVLGRLPEPAEMESLSHLAQGRAWEWRYLQQPQGTVADKLRKALDKQINLKLENQPLGDVLKWLFDNSGVSIVTTVPPGVAGKMVTVNVQGIPLGAAFQLVEDVGGVQFGVRDYGILVSDKLPSGVTRLHDFWKAPEKTKSAPDKPKGASHNPPPKSVEGKVTAIEQGSGLVEISVGSNAGLAQGHTLEVYRITEGKGGKYLGTLRIEKVSTAISVGTIINKPNAPVEIGDRVSSQFFVD